MNIEVRVFCSIDPLYKIATPFLSRLPYKVEKKVCWANALKDFMNFYDAINNDNDFTIGMDGDFFIYNPGVVARMIEDMKAEGIAYCGMPEKGVSGHRSHCLGSSEDIMNGGFLLFQNKLLKPIILPAEKLLNYRLQEYCRDSNQYERIWSGFRYFNDNNVSHEHLTGRDHEDGISTWLEYRGTPFALHTWYGRDFVVGAPTEIPNNHDRIMARQREALALLDAKKGAL